MFILNRYSSISDAYHPTRGNIFAVLSIYIAISLMTVMSTNFFSFVFGNHTQIELGLFSVSIFSIQALLYFTALSTLKNSKRFSLILAALISTITAFQSLFLLYTYGAFTEWITTLLLLLFCGTLIVPSTYLISSIIAITKTKNKSLELSFSISCKRYRVVMTANAILVILLALMYFDGFARWACYIVIIVACSNMVVLAYDSAILLRCLYLNTKQKK